MSGWWTIAVLAGALSTSGCFSESTPLDMSSDPEASSTGTEDMPGDSGSGEASGSSGSPEPADSTSDGDEVACESREADRFPRPVELIVAIDPGMGETTAIQNEVADALILLAEEPVERSVVVLSPTEYDFGSQCGPLGCGDDCAPDPPDHLHVASDPMTMQPFAMFANPAAFECALRGAPPETPEFDRVVVHAAFDGNPAPTAVEAFQTQLGELGAQYYVACPECEFDDGDVGPLEELAFNNRGFSADSEADGELMNLISWAGAARGECYWLAPTPEGYDRDDLELRGQILDEGFVDLEHVDSAAACDGVEPDGSIPRQWYYAGDDDPVVVLCPPACVESLFAPLYLTTVVEEFCA